MSVATGTVEVDPVVVLYAIRYGLNRATSAHDQALDLIRQHWPALRPFRDSLLADLRYAAARPHPVLSRGERQRLDQLITWMEAHR